MCRTLTAANPYQYIKLKAILIKVNVMLTVVKEMLENYII